MLSLLQNLSARNIAWDDGWICLIAHEVFMSSLNIIVGGKWSRQMQVGSKFLGELYSNNYILGYVYLKIASKIFLVTWNFRVLLC